MEDELSGLEEEPLSMKHDQISINKYVYLKTAVPISEVDLAKEWGSSRLFEVLYCIL